MEDNELNTIDEEYSEVREIDLDEVELLSSRLIEGLKNVHKYFSYHEQNWLIYTETRLSFIKRVIESLAIDVFEILPKLNEKEIKTLGAVEWRCLRACSRLLKSTQLSDTIKNTKISFEAHAKLKNEFEIVESLSSEILAFIDLHKINNGLPVELSSVLYELRLAKELYIQLIDRLDSIRGESLAVIGQAKDEATKAKDDAVNDSNTIKELVSKSTNAYLAADFSDRKKGNSWELVFWFLIMSFLLTVDAWLIWRFDFAAKDIWQNRLIDLGLIGFVATVAFWMGRNFRAAMHQRSILDQRIATLKTFQAFYEKVDNQSLKDSIVLEASRTIFSHASSGYAIEAHVNDLPSFSDLARAASLAK